MQDKEFGNPLNINKDTMVPLGFISILAMLIYFGADVRNSNVKNTEAITKLNKKLDQEIAFSKAERLSLQERMADRFDKVEKEQQFLRERMIISMNEIRRVVYKIEGQISSEKERSKND